MGLIMKMRSCLFSLLGLFVLLTLSSCTAKSSSVGVNITLEATRAHAEQFKDAWGQQNAVLLAAEYEADAVSVGNVDRIPLEGRQEIEAYFKSAFSQQGPDSYVRLDVEVADATPMGGGYLFADGTYVISGSTGEVVKSGKWGNVSRIQNGKMRLVQESAHTGISADSNLFAPEGDTGLAGVEPVEFDQPLLEAFMARFEEAWKNQDAAALAGEFTEDAIRVVSSQPVTLRGRAAIEKSFEDNFSAESRFGATTIDTFVLGYQSIDAEHFIANGIWKIKDPSGAVIAQGQWGNLWRIEDGVARMRMESAGAFIFE